MFGYEGYRTVLIAALSAYIVYLNILIQIEYCKNQILLIKCEANFERKEIRDKLMKRLWDDQESRSVLRMGLEAFQRLYSILRGTGRLKDNNYSCVEEQVAKFLHVLSHNVRNRTIRFIFGRSIGTVCNHFHRVLRALISLEDRFLVQPTEETPIPNEILTREGRFYPYFEIPFYPS
jgi:hypothetical protein